MRSERPLGFGPVGLALLLCLCPLGPRGQYGSEGQTSLGSVNARNDLNTVQPRAPRQQPLTELGAGAAILRQNRKITSCNGCWVGGPTYNPSRSSRQSEPHGRTLGPSRASGPRRASSCSPLLSALRLGASLAAAAARRVHSARAVPRLRAVPRHVRPGPPTRAALQSRANGVGHPHTRRRVRGIDLTQSCHLPLASSLAQSWELGPPSFAITDR